MKEEKLLYADETYAIRGAAFEVYKEMGNAFDENVYQECMEIALARSSLNSRPVPRLRMFIARSFSTIFGSPDAGWGF